MGEREREVNDSRYYFMINLCGTGATPGSADRQVSALRYVTDCAMRPVGIYRTNTVFMSIFFVLCGHKGPYNWPGAVLYSEG